MPTTNQTGYRIPEVDIARVKRWCDGRTPAQEKNLTYTDMEAEGLAITVTQYRRCFEVIGEEDWITFPIALLEYHEAGHQWSLSWYQDGESSWTHYRNVKPTRFLAELLDEIDNDPLRVFSR